MKSTPLPSSLDSIVPKTQKASYKAKEMAMLESKQMRILVDDKERN